MSARAEFLAARDFLLRHRDDYAVAYRDFRWPVLRQFNWATDYFDQIPQPERTALWIAGGSGEETRLSFADLRIRSNQVANFLRRLGVGRGSRILLMLGNVAPLWETMLAAMKLGAVVIPSTTLLNRDDLNDRLTRGRVDLVICQAAEAEKFIELPPGCRRVTVGEEITGWVPFATAYSCSQSFVSEGSTEASDLLLLYFTSGTTALAKLVSHTHQSYPVGHLSTMYWLGLQAGDVHLNISSPGWAKHAWSCFFAPWNAEATVFVHVAARFDAREALDAITAHEVTSLCAPPTVWRLFVQQDLRRWPVRLRRVASAGEPLNPEVIATVQQAWKLEVSDGYGQTETTAQVGNSPGTTIKPGSMGRPLPGYRVALLDGEGRETNEGEVALDLEQRPVGLTPGYEDDPARTAAAMAEGYYRTGDLARRDDDGYLTFLARSDDAFKSADYRVSPFELESALLEHPAVAEAAVVASPDPIRLAVPKAYVVLAAGWEPTAEVAAEIFRHIREHISPFRRVRRIEFAALPKTISGKIRRVDLRRREEERHPRHSYDPARRAEGEFWEEDFPGP